MFKFFPQLGKMVQRDGVCGHWAMSLNKVAEPTIFLRSVQGIFKENWDFGNFDFGRSVLKK